MTGIYVYVMYTDSNIAVPKVNYFALLYKMSFPIRFLQNSMTVKPEQRSPSLIAVLDFET